MNIAILGRQRAANVISQPRLTEQQIEWLKAVQTAEERLAAETAAKAAAEAEYLESTDGRLEAYHSGEPPEASMLGVKIRGLLPARARLVRLAAWIDQAQAEVLRLEEARDRLLTMLGAPEISRKELDILKERDRNGLVAWVLSGALGEKYTVEAFRRQQIEAKLAQQDHESEIARHGLATVESEIAFARRVVETLRQRREAFARAAVLEAAAARMDQYEAEVKRLAEQAADLAGLRMALSGHQVGPVREYQVQLPRVGNGDARLVIAAAEIEQDHRGVKGRYGPMRGFKNPRSAGRFCRTYDQLRNFLRLRS